MGKNNSVIIDILKGFEIGRKVIMNIVFWAGGAILLLLLFSGPGLHVPENGILLINPRGVLTDQLSYDTSLSGSFSSGGEVLLRDLTGTIRSAARDQRINAIFMDLTDLYGASLAHLEEVAEALEDFNAAGKNIFAWSADYSQSAFYLASFADKAAVDPFGRVFLPGLGAYQWYFGDTFDRFFIDWNVIRVGEYKSAVEPYTGSGMSDLAEANMKSWMDQLWNSYLSAIAEEREIPEDTLVKYVSNYGELLRQKQSGADLALSAGLVDQVASRKDFFDGLLMISGGSENDVIAYEDYLLVTGGGYLPVSGSKIGVVTASGAIYGGELPLGSVGSKTFLNQVERALEDNISALVVRVDSPGGEVFASEEIRRGLLSAKELGVPVVVSMGGSAASGGYWISTAADWIVAGENTITGSIGIYGMAPNYSRALREFFSIEVDGYGTTPYADTYRSDLPMSDHTKAMLEASIQEGYNQFLQVVSEGRNIKIDVVNLLGRGRVYSGNQAMELGLVDELGGMETALRKARELAGLRPDAPAVVYEPEPSLMEMALMELMNSFQISSRISTQAAPMQLSGMNELLEEMEKTGILDIANFQDPREIYAHFIGSINF